MPADRIAGRPAPAVPGRATAHRVSLVLFAALAVAIGSLHVLFGSQTWWFVVVAGVAVVLAVAAVTRRLTANPILPSIAAVLGVLVVLTVFFAPGSAILAVVPTLGTVQRFLDLAAAAGGSIYRQSVPAEADTGIVFLLTAGLGLVAVAADAVVITLRRPALAGIPLAGIMAVVPITESDVVDPLAFALVSACYLLLLLAGRGRSQPGLAAAIGASAIVGALVIPSALPAIGRAPAAVPGVADGINPVIDLGEDLRRSAERDVLSYTTASGTPHYLRLVSLDLFTGASWRPGKTRLDTGNSVDSFAAPPGVTAAIASTTEVTSVDIVQLASPWLPTPYPATGITGLSEDWYWEPEGFSVSSEDATTRGESYEVTSLQLLPTPQQLLDAQSTAGAEFDRYRDLPDDLPSVISDTAGAVTSASPTNYQKALALQEFFRSPEFRYSEEAPVDGDYDGTGMDVVAQFLEERAGYCIHFASAMAVMARSVGIPSRVVVGFLPGDRTSGEGDDPVFEVTSHDLHSWPELYFDDIGWVQFEPTPGRGELNQYADVTAAGVPAPDETVAPSPVASASVAPSPVPSQPVDDAAGRTPGSAAGEASRAPEVALTAGGLLLLVLLPAIVRATGRRRLSLRLAGGEASALAAWAEVLQTAVDLRMPVSVTETPRATARTLARGGEPLARLLDAVESDQYGLPAVQTAAGGAAEGMAAAAIATGPGLASDVDAVRRALLGAAPRAERLRALLLPASLWRRIVHPLRRDRGLLRTDRAATTAGSAGASRAGSRPTDPAATGPRPRA